MPDILVDGSHKCPSAIGTLVKLVKEAGFTVKMILAMPSDRAPTDGSSFAEAIRRAEAYDIPEHFAERLVVANATLTVSHDVGIIHFRTSDDGDTVFCLKKFLDELGFSYVITHVDTGVTISDISGVTELPDAA